MKIKILDDTNADELKNMILASFAGSRFVFVRGITVESKTTLNLHRIRLSESKPYCGSHPESCDVRPMGGAMRPQRNTTLEGADWVDFNDHLNDVLDHMNCSADISSMVCVIRRGLNRRIYYGSQLENDAPEWDRNGDEDDYENWCGKFAPNSTFPSGTPGLYERMQYDYLIHNPRS